MPSSDPNLLLLLDRKPPAHVGAETGLELPRLHFGPRDAAALGSSDSPELLQSYLNHFATPLLPLVSCIDGQAHPDFPRNLLQYHLLTPAQLDHLAWHFHQVSPPRPESSCYPIHVPPWVHLDSTREIRLETKRRRFGRFIGLQGCESPVQGTPVVSSVYNPFLESCESFADQVVVAPLLGENEMEIIDRMLERMEWEWEEALVKAREGLGARPRRQEVRQTFFCSD